MDDPSAGSPTERFSPSKKKMLLFSIFEALFLKARISLGPDYILCKKKKDWILPMEFFFFARQHLVCGLHPWNWKKKIQFFRTWLRCLSNLLFTITIPKDLISWPPERFRKKNRLGEKGALRISPQFDDVAKRGKKKFSFFFPTWLAFFFKKTFQGFSKIGVEKKEKPCYDFSFL